MTLPRDNDGCTPKNRTKSKPGIREGEKTFLLSSFLGQFNPYTTITIVIEFKGRRSKIGH